jgi:hypothetical protein
MRLFVYLFLINLPFWSYTQTWELEKNKHQIQIYSKVLDTSSHKYYKAITHIKPKISLQQISRVLTDGDKLKEWNYKMTQSKLLAHPRDHEYVIWMYNNFIWPVKDRDNISNLKVSQATAQKIIIDISPEKNFHMPLKKNVIRMTNFKGKWEIVAETHHIKIIQYMYGDPKSNFPKWMQQSMIVKAMHYNFLNLRKQLEQISPE